MFGLMWAGRPADKNIENLLPVPNACWHYVGRVEQPLLRICLVETGYGSHKNGTRYGLGSASDQLPVLFSLSHAFL